MSNFVIHRSERVYGSLLKFYPKRYLEEFGEEMKYVFSESLKDAYTENGEQGIVKLWARTIIDLGTSLVTQHFENQKGVDTMKTNSNDLLMQNKVFVWIALATGLILLIPFISMQFTSEVDWSRGDFTVMGVLLFGMGSLFVLAARKVRKKEHRIAVGFAVALALFYIWAELAVGIFTNWGS